MRSERPRISSQQLKWNLLDWFYELGGWALLLGLWVYILIQFGRLPEIIPTHFAMDGTPDGFSRKVNIFILPSIVTVLYAGMTIINRLPHLYVYMVTITPLNAKKNYLSATRKVRFLKFLIVILFCFICFQAVEVAMGRSEGLGHWFFPLTFIIFIGFTFIALFGAMRHTHVMED